MKNKIIGLLLVTTFLMTGCLNKDLKNNIGNMEIGNEKLESYQLSLSLYGTYNDKKINDRITIDNYKNSQYKITIANMNSPEDENEEVKDDVYYLVDGNGYKETADGREEATVPYTKTNQYHDYLKDLKNTKKLEDEKIGSKTYTVYEGYMDNKTIQKVVEELNIKDIQTKDDVYVKVYTDGNGYIYKVNYDFGKSLEGSKLLKMDIYFHRINTVKPLTGF